MLGPANMSGNTSLPRPNHDSGAEVGRGRRIRIRSSSDRLHLLFIFLEKASNSAKFPVENCDARGTARIYDRNASATNADRIAQYIEMDSRSW